MRNGFASAGAPGSLFSPSGRHANPIRLSACHHFSGRNVHALLTPGELLHGQRGGCSGPVKCLDGQVEGNLNPYYLQGTAEIFVP